MQERAVTARDLYYVKKVKFFSNTKDKFSSLNHLYVAYKFMYPGCCANYVRKTETKVFERNVKHSWSDKDIVTSKINVNGYVGVKQMLERASLTPLLFSDSIVDDVEEPTMLHINLAQIKKRKVIIIRIGIFLFFKMQ